VCSDEEKKTSMEKEEGIQGRSYGQRRKKDLETQKNDFIHCVSKNTRATHINTTKKAQEKSNWV